MIKLYCICEIKFAFKDNAHSAFLKFSKSEISSLGPFHVAVLPGLCQRWPKTPKKGLRMGWFIFFMQTLIFLYVICKNVSRIELDR